MQYFKTKITEHSAFITSEPVKKSQRWHFPPKDNYFECIEKSYDYAKLSRLEKR